VGEVEPVMVLNFYLRKDLLSGISLSGISFSGGWTRRILEDGILVKGLVGLVLGEYG
jgi:hypothetical protein